jgi:hypothetical protein
LKDDGRLPCGAAIGWVEERDSEFDDFEFEEVRSRCHRRAVAAVVFAGLAVPPVLVVLFSGRGADDEVAVFALDGPEQLEAFKSGLSVDGVCAAGEALLELGALASGMWMALIFTTDVVFLSWWSWVSAGGASSAERADFY